MSSTSEVLQELENEVAELQRNARFCLNDYDYHHKNEEEILKSLGKQLEDSFTHGKEYHDNVSLVMGQIKKARQTLQQADEMLKKLGIAPKNGSYVDAEIKLEKLGASPSDDDDDDKENMG